MPKRKSPTEKRLVILDNPDDTDTLRRREKARIKRSPGRKPDQDNRR